MQCIFFERERDRETESCAFQCTWTFLYTWGWPWISDLPASTSQTTGYHLPIKKNHTIQMHDVTHLSHETITVTERSEIQEAHSVWFQGKYPKKACRLVAMVEGLWGVAASEHRIYSEEWKYSKIDCGNSYITGFIKMTNCILWMGESDGLEFISQ